MPKKRRITAEDLYRLQLITDCRISPDGKHAVYVQNRVEKKTEKKFANLWIVPTSGGRPKQFTYGDQTDAMPRWSPDGKEIAFISNRKDEQQPQVHIIPVDGGEARPLTDMKGTFGNIEWSPDGRRLLCFFQKKDAEAVERESDEAKKKLGVVSRHVDRMFYKYDGRGYLPKERTHIWTINAKSGNATQLTDHDVYDETSPCYSPDGRWIAFISNRTPEPDLALENDDIFVMPSSGGELRKIPTPMGGKSSLSFSPDGTRIAYFGSRGKGDWWQNTKLFVVPADGSTDPVDLTGHHDVDISAFTLGDTYAATLTPPVWSPDGSKIYFQVSRHGRTELCAVPAEGGELELVISEPSVVGMVSFDAACERIAYVNGTMTDVCQVWTRNLGNNTARCLTRVNTVLRNVDLGETEEVWFKGPHDNDVQGWILKPPGFDESKQYPSILEIHGGPRAQYGHCFMHEFYFLAAQGYVVYYCNPRGSQGYGEEHSKAITNNWGTVDYDDVMAWAEYMKQKPYIDPARMGVTGGSYGGYMTNWIITHTDSFKAAATQRCVSNLISMYGSSDFNWGFQREFGDTPPWENLENYWRQSPMKYIGNAKTPTLVIHSEMDQRCDIEQGEQVFVALKKLGVDTEMVRFPDEPHGLSRGGRTDRRVVRLGHILRWFDKYLKD